MSGSPSGGANESAVLNALDLGVAILDAQANITYANPSVLAIVERTLEDVKGRNFGQVFPGLDIEIDWRHAVRSATERGRSVRLARRPVETSTGERFFDIALIPLCTGEAGALLTLRDVTEAVRVEAKLLRQARTRAIANLGDSMAHEIRNPLNSIHMNVQLLREGLGASDPDRAALDKSAATVQREIKRLDGVVRDFLQFSRSSQLQLRRAAPNLVVRAALDSLDGQIREKKLKVVVDLQSARPVRMDPDRLQRSFYNILLNAVQVLPEGGTITCRSLDEEHRCLVEISDDGPGLDLMKNPKLFDLFYTTKPGGTGLGLPIANRIVEEHGGRIAVSSRPEHGASFVIFLPYEGPDDRSEDGPTTVPVAGREDEDE
ncbi:MAG: ATP-binding protein [Planctomycetota bacterium]